MSTPAAAPIAHKAGWFRKMSAHGGFTVGRQRPSTSPSKLAPVAHTRPAERSLAIPGEEISEGEDQADELQGPAVLGRHGLRSSGLGREGQDEEAGDGHREPSKERSARGREHVFEGREVIQEDRGKKGARPRAKTGGRSHERQDEHGIEQAFDEIGIGKIKKRVRRKRDRHATRTRAARARIAGRSAAIGRARGLAGKE